MTPPFPHAGETFALLCALTWAVAVILFRKSGERAHPLGLNLFKNILATVLVLATLAVLGQPLARAVPARYYLLLLASGALGIGLGDSFFFASLNRLGATRAAIVGCLYSPSVITLAALFLHERITWVQLLGTVAILAAIVEGSVSARRENIPHRDLIPGVAFGVAGVAATAVGIILIKPILAASPLLWATQIRLAGGVAVLALILAFTPRRKEIVATVLPGPGWGFTLSSSAVGAYGAIILWLAGLKYTYVSIAVALNQTSNIFVFVLAALLLREPFTWRRGISIGLATGGALLITLS